jgi:hypothetical protein
MPQRAPVREALKLRFESVFLGDHRYGTWTPQHSPTCRHGDGHRRLDATADRFGQFDGHSGGDKALDFDHQGSADPSGADVSVLDT